MTAQGAPDRSRTVQLDGREMELSRLDKVLFPDPAITKGDVVDYYRRISDAMLPHLIDRPLVLQRFPDGIDQDGFFQKNTPEHAPEWIQRIAIDTADGGSTSYSVIDGVSGLVHLADQGTVTFHTLLAEADAPRRPVEIIFDLDPADDELDPVRDAASELRQVLDDLALAPRVKSSGSRGLHVLIEVTDDEIDFDATATFARRVAEIIVGRGPFTLQQRTAKRGDRLFVDVLRNAVANHAVAPYSLRPLPGAPVAAPLHWDEALDASFHPRRITIDNIFRRLGQIDDPWQRPDRPATTIAEALAELGEPEETAQRSPR